MKRYTSITVLILALLAGLPSCNKGGDNGPDSPGGFNKTAMLRHYMDRIIIPRYTTMQHKLEALQTSSAAFAAAPGVTTQSVLRTAYTDAYVQYERIAVFQFGPAETALQDIFLNYSGGLDYNFNSAGELTGFSVDTAAIEKNISTGTYDLKTMSRSSFYSQGFGALGYLWFEPNAITRFSASPANRIKYAGDALTRIRTIIDQVASGFVSYRSEFIANTKTNVGSPIGNMINQLAYQMDLLKGPRLGWPFGKQSNGSVFATKCEGYYAGVSVQLAVTALTNLKNVYTGFGSGKGFSDYLVALNSATLNNDILAQFDVAIGKLQAIPDPLSNSLTSQAASVDAAYKEIQKLVTLLKTDFASATAVQITYMDSDGD